MIVRKDGIYTIKKDGTQYYRVFKKRTRIASFLLLSQPNEYVDSLINKEKKSNY